MKNLVTYSISKARSVQKKRQFRQILILCAVILLLVGALAVIRVSVMKDQMDALFPAENESGIEVSASGSQSTVPSVSGETTGVSDTAASGTSESETTPSTSGSESGSTESTSEATEKIGPAALVPEIDVFIPSSNSLQTVSHNERDSAYHTLQKDVQTLLDSQVGIRCGFYYINLKNGEEFGYNETAPFVMGAAINLPINTVLCDYAQEETLSYIEVMAVTSDDKIAGSGVLQDESNGAQHYIRELMNLSMTSSDNTATAMLLRRLGGIDVVNDRLKLISDFVDFRSTTTYKDFANVQRSGMNRSSTLDLAKYAAYFYSQYMAYPSIYQPLFNDLAHSNSEWGVGSNLPSGVLVCHKTGSTAEYSSETDVALIFANEPYVVCVTVECADPAAARALQQQLGDLVYAYLSGCYS